MTRRFLWAGVPGRLLWLMCGTGGGARASDDAHEIELRTDGLVYVVGEDGLNHAFRSRNSDKDYLVRRTPFLWIEKAGARIASTSVQYNQGTFEVKFGDSGITAQIRVQNRRTYLKFELTGVSDGSVSRVQLADLPLTLNRYVSTSLASCRDDDYGAVVVPLNIETHSSAAGAVLMVEADRRVRLQGTAFALAGGPAKGLLDRIERIELDNGLPHPTLGGAWARRSPEQVRSYLFCDLTEANADAIISYAKAGGFGYIVVYAGTWNATCGTYLVNLKNFPAGETGLKDVVRRVHSAGLKIGIHNLDMVVSKTDPLVTPVPAAGFLMYPDARRTLAADVGSTEAFLPTTASPAGLLGKDDKSRFRGRDLRIGDEIITYGDLRTTAPFGFSGCQRGAYGTKAGSHPAGAAVDNFSEFIGYYRPDVKGSLYDKVARAEAAALDTYGFDFLYPDGTGESLGNWPESPEWYIYNLQLAKLFGYTKREVLWAHAPITDYSWHIFSRGNTTDFVQVGMMKHFDAVSLAGAKHSIAELQPFELGWFGYFKQAPDAKATRPREMQYAWSKALGYNAAMSLETSKEALDGNGRTAEILALVRDWETLKLQGYFPERVRERLRAPGAEFELAKDRKGSWKVLPVRYSPERQVVSGDRWQFENRDPAQPLRVSIEAALALAAFGDPANVVMIDPENPPALNTAGSGPAGGPARQSDGVSFKLTAQPDQFQVSAVNRSTTPGWGCAEVILGGPRDLRQNRALATWVEGDGSGAILHFVMEDASRWSVRDYYVRLDFKGRKYVEMREAAEGEVYDFNYPFSSYWAIRNIDFETISRVYIFLTGLAPGGSAQARFGRVEALREMPLAVEGPELTVNGRSVAFPLRLEKGWYLEYEGDHGLRVFDGNGSTRTTWRPDVVAPVLRQGPNELGFHCNRGGPAKVTLVTRGQPLN